MKHFNFSFERVKITRLHGHIKIKETFEQSIHHGDNTDNSCMCPVLHMYKHVNTAKHSVSVEQEVSFYPAVLM
jgi:hypothetical protein